MRYMNEYDIEEALDRFDLATTPHRAALAQIVSDLAEWANRNSDGWVYWPKPVRAAAKAMEQIDPTDWASIHRLETEDCTLAEYTAAVRPIKAFLTRHGVRLSEITSVPV